MHKSLTALAVLAAGATIAGPAAAAPTHSAHFIDCAGHAIAAPHEFDLFCGDGGDLLSHLRWSDWGAATATATGTETVNTCEPDCAAGHYTSHRVRLSVAGLSHGRYRSLRVGSERFELTSRGPVLA